MLAETLNNYRQLTKANRLTEAADHYESVFPRAHSAVQQTSPTLAGAVLRDLGSDIGAQLGRRPLAAWLSLGRELAPEQCFR